MSSIDNLPDGWMETTLGEVCDVKGGKRLPKGETLVSKKNKHPYIRITDFSGNSIDKSKLQFVPNDTFEKISRYIVNENDIIISIVGTIGLVAKIDVELNNASLTENCNKLVNLRGMNNDFIYYYLTSRIGQFEINKNTVGAVQKKLPIYGVQSIKINLPKDIKEQKAIANVLTAFDDKIELLQQQNQTLETIAQTIFKQWFGKYQLGDELPEGWRVGIFGDLVKLSSGKGVKKSEYEDDGEYEIIGANGAIGRLNKFLINEKVIITGRVGTLGTVFILNKPAWVSDNVLISNPIIEKSFYYAYFTLKKFNFSALNTGSTQPLITQGDLKSVDIIIPNSLVLEEFEKISFSLFSKIEANQIQIQSLTKTRDTLLPKLMSGQVRVKIKQNEIREDRFVGNNGEGWSIT